MLYRAVMTRAVWVSVRPAIYACVAIASAVANAEDAAPPQLVAVDTSRDCGAYCVDLALRMAGHEIIPPFDELRRQAAVDADGQTTLLAVAEALASNGVRIAVGRRDQRATGPFVARLNRTESGAPASHFVIIAPLTERDVVLYSPPLWVREVSWLDLRTRIDDVVLVFATKNSSDAPPAWWLVGGAVVAIGLCAVVLRRHWACAPLVLVLLHGGCADHPPRGVAFEQLAIDLGVITGERRVPLTVVNDTAEDVTIARPKVSCGCVQLDLDMSPLPAGAKRTGSAVVAAYPGDAKSVDIRLECSGGYSASCVIRFVGGERTRPREDSWLDGLSVGIPHRFVLKHVVSSEAIGTPVPGDPDPHWYVAYDNPIRVLETSHAFRDGQWHLEATWEITPDYPGPGEDDILCRLGRYTYQFALHWDAAAPSDAAVTSSRMLLPEGTDLEPPAVLSTLLREVPLAFVGSGPIEVQERWEEEEIHDATRAGVIRWRLDWRRPFDGKTECLQGPVEQPERRVVATADDSYTVEQTTLAGLEWRAWTTASTDVQWPESAIAGYFNNRALHDWCAFIKKHRPYEATLDESGTTCSVFLVGSRALRDVLHQWFANNSDARRPHTGDCVGWLVKLQRVGGRLVVTEWTQLHLLQHDADLEAATVVYWIKGVLPCVAQHVTKYEEYREVGGWCLPSRFAFRDATRAFRAFITHAARLVDAPAETWSLRPPSSFSGEGVHMDMRSGAVTRYTAGEWRPDDVAERMIREGEAIAAARSATGGQGGWVKAGAVCALIAMCVVLVAARRSLGNAA